MSIVRRKDERPEIVKVAMGGPGEMISHPITQNDEELYGRGRLFSDNTLEPASAVGWHVHNGDGEIYYILSGQGEYNDNGTITTVRAGDVTITYPGEGHSITAIGDEPMRFIALILYE